MADATDCHGNWIFSGPDGIKPFARYKLRDTSYIGHTTFSPERTSDVRHMWRAPWSSANFPAKSGWVGAIGWNTWSYNDWRLLKSGNQIRSGPFRTSVAHRIVNEGVYWLLIDVKTSKIANLCSDNSETTNKLLLTYVACIYFTVMHAFIEWFFAGQPRNVAFNKNLQGFSQLACNICLRKIKTLWQLFKFLLERVGSSGAYKRTSEAGNKLRGTARILGRKPSWR